MGATQQMLEDCLSADKPKCARCGFDADHNENVHDYLGNPEDLKWPPR